MEKAYKNTGYFMLLLILLVLIGFYRTYFGQIPDFKELTVLSHSQISIFDHFHAASASLWIFIMILQPFLISYGKFKIHRTVGKLSYLAFPIMILSFIPLIERILHSQIPILAYLPIADTFLLILFYSLAIYNRKNTPKHMRYMIGTALVFVGPTWGRIGNHLLHLNPHLTQNTYYAITYLILVGLILLDRKRTRNYGPYLLVMGAIAIHQILFLILL